MFAGTARSADALGNSFSTATNYVSTIVPAVTKYYLAARWSRKRWGSDNAQPRIKLLRLHQPPSRERLHRGTVRPAILSRTRNARFENHSRITSRPFDHFRTDAAQ